MKRLAIPLCRAFGVLADVLRLALKESEVFKAIVCRIAIQVVNNLNSRQQAPKVPLHHKSVL